MSSASSKSDANDAILVGPGDIQDFNAENILPLPVEELVEIREWLQPTPYDLERSEFNRHLASHLPGTGSWLTSTATYQQWHNGDDNGCLWIKGIPGSGKSVMAASIIHQLLQEEIPVLYFFFRQIIDANHQPVAAMRDWLCQILRYSPPLQAKLKDYLEEGRSIDSLAPSDLWKGLKLALCSLPKVYCVTDALDEMDQGNNEFVHALVDLGKWRPLNVKVLITSRPVVTVENALRPFSIPQIRLEERLVDIDIASYVQCRLHNSSVPHGYWSSIVEAIPGRANGLFLYAKLSLDAFLEPGADIQEVLKSLPADLNVMYNALLREHAKRSNVPDELQLLVLQFVTHATRPLRLLEIAEVVKTTHVPNKHRSLKETKDLVRSACGPLLEILPDETVSVVHHSFTEFLKGFTRSSDSNDSAYPVLQPGSTNARLAVACLDYLRSGCLDELKIPKRPRDDILFHPKRILQTEIILQFPFLEYAAKNWYIHTRRATKAGTDMLFFYELLDIFFADSQRFNSWLDLSWPSTAIEGITPLHVAAQAGLAQYATYLFQKAMIEADVRDECHNTPLYWAADTGNAEVARMLLAHGADPDGEQSEGRKPLHRAASKNHDEVAEVLLVAGADPLTPKTREAPSRYCGSVASSIGDTPLMYACDGGHVEVVAKILPFLEDANHYYQALSWAAESGHAKVVDFILRQTAVDVNVKYRGETFLFKACKAEDVNAAEVLLRAGADPNVLCDNAGNEPYLRTDRLVRSPGTRRHTNEPRGFTALHAVCRFRRTMSFPGPPECLQLLLKAGADIHLKDPDGLTAFHYACVNNAELIKPLLEAGADPTVETDAGATPLHTDGETDKELLPVLLGTGLIDINKAMSRTGRSPLHCRIEGRCEDAVPAFLEYKPDVNATDLNGNGPLHMALQNTFVDGRVIDALLSAGAYPNLQNRDGETPLHKMCMDCRFASNLCNAGANLELQDCKGQTPLFKFTCSSWSRNFMHGDKKELFHTLTDLGARLDTHDYNGRTLLHQCCDNASRLKYLVGLGLSPNVTDNQGNTLFHETAARTSESDQLKALQHLSSLGLDIDRPNHDGKTVLHVLCASTNYDLHTPMKEHPLDFVLRVCKNPSPRDFDGAQPLHFAATISEVYVFKLLNAKADVLGATHEGITVLHIAARARQPGVIGLVLSRLVGLDKTMRDAFINQKDNTGRAALHYACRSGRPETVKELLENGADPNLSDDDGHITPFAECAHFESEQELWTTDSVKFVGQTINAAGILLDDKTRPFWDPCRYSRRGRDLESEQDTTRLEEILDLLVLYGAAVTGKTRINTIRAALSNQSDYTVDCLLRMNNRIPDAKPIKYSTIDTDYLICTYRLEAVKRALRESGRFENIETSPISPRRFTEKLIARRHYDIFEEKVSEGFDLLQPAWPGRSLLHEFASLGYSNLMARYCTRESALKFDDHKLCKQAEEDEGCCSNYIEPLLLTACTRYLPNMEMVHLLVEKFGVNIDARRRKSVYRGNKNETIPSSGALHWLAQGFCWWHVDKALPYLITKGANLNLCDEEGRTPLHIASDCSIKKGPFSKEAACILLQSGANVNSVDNNGKTCLSKTGGDLELIERFLSHGAKVSAAAVFSALDQKQVEVLELLLSHGDYANLRQSGPEKLPKDTNYRAEIIRSEIFPLLYAASYNKKYDKTVRLRIMPALLRHGANPYATFVKHYRKEDSGPYDKHLSGDPDELTQNWIPHACTVIHEILSGGHMAEPLFKLSSLQLEYRDPSGCSLLLAAFKSPVTPMMKMDCGEGVTKTIFQELIDRGADATAQDNDGKTILHMARFDDKTETGFAETLKAVIAKNNGLVHQPDHAGDTPLHYALREHNYAYIDQLLEAGSDPLQTDSKGKTALHHLAAKLNSHAKAEVFFNRFLNVGVNINSRDKEGSTPLFKYMKDCDVFMNAPGEGFFEPVFDLFQKAGADFFACNDAGSSLLHVLASKKVGFWLALCGDEEHARWEVVQRFKFLMDLGLDPMAEDARQRTSLDVAAACGNEHILKLFKRKPMV